MEETHRTRSGKGGDAVFMPFQGLDASFFQHTTVFTSQEALVNQSSYLDFIM